MDSGIAVFGATPQLSSSLLLSLAVVCTVPVRVELLILRRGVSMWSVSFEREDSKASLLPLGSDRDVPVELIELLLSFGYGESEHVLLLALVYLSTSEWNARRRLNDDSTESESDDALEVEERRSRLYLSNE